MMTRRLVLRGTFVAAGVVGLVVTEMMPIAKAEPRPIEAVSAASCAASQLTLSIPEQAQYQHGGGGTGSWTILLTNQSESTCELSGYPGVSLSPSDGNALTFSQGPANVLSSEPGPAVLEPGDAAAATVVDDSNEAGCDGSWLLSIDLPTGGGTLSLDNQAAAFAPCDSSANPEVTEFFPAAGLTPAPAPVPPAATCTPSQVQLTEPSQATLVSGDLLIAASLVGSQPCDLIQAQPTLTVTDPSGVAQVAKVASVPSDAAVASATLSGPVELTAGQEVGFLLSSSAYASSAACSSVSSVELFPAGGTFDPSTGLTLPSMGSLCGTPLIEPYVSLPSLTAGMMRRALKANVRAAQERTHHTHSAGGLSPLAVDTPAGFYYGEDSSAAGVQPGQNGNAYTVPDLYPGGLGFYAGSNGGFFDWKNCGGTFGTGDVNSAVLNDTNANISQGIGYGAEDIWVLAGPGVDTSITKGEDLQDAENEAYSFGESQAERTINFDLSGYNFYGSIIWMDVEDSDYNGWNEYWSGQCGGWNSQNRSLGTGVPYQVDRAVFNGYWSEIYNDSTYFPGIYCAGGPGASSWDGIFSSNETLSSTDEWTYSPSTGSSSTQPDTFNPSGFNNATFFAGITGSSNYAYAWQWSGGAGSSNASGDDLDQYDTTASLTQ